jgi:hypothetical protein
MYFVLAEFASLVHLDELNLRALLLGQ